jgi:hypothetical protein
MQIKNFLAHPPHPLSLCYSVVSPSNETVILPPWENGCKADEGGMLVRLLLANQSVYVILSGA